MKLFDIESTIFPNPITDKAIITYKLSNPTIVKLNIFDELGKKVKLTDSYNGIIGENSIQLDFTNVKQGIYFVSLSIEGQQFTKQIIKK